MNQSFFIIGQQVLILFIMIFVGFICAKRSFFSEEGIKCITNFVLYIIIPCVIINSFHREFDSAMMGNLLKAFFAAVFVHSLNIIVVNLLVHDKDECRERVLKFASIFSNCGYMALPLQEVLLGQDGVFLGAVFIAVFNIFNWTYGLFLMGGKGTKISFKTVFLNPGVIGIIIGLLFFLTPLKLPHILLAPLQSFASMNTPLPTIVIGFYLARVPGLSVLKDAKLCLALLLRLVILPVAEMILLYLFGLRGSLLASIVIAASAPCAANTAMFAGKFGRDTSLSVTLVSVSTLFSILTMPVIVQFCMR
ncbi:MAG: AEC family transporter [Treponemataceae bacterium]|nr:AEC family transporter [Treponemataceae bacterium]